MHVPPKVVVSYGYTTTSKEIITPTTFHSFVVYLSVQMYVTRTGELSEPILSKHITATPVSAISMVRLFITIQSVLARLLCEIFNSFFNIGWKI